MRGFPMYDPGHPALMAAHARGYTGGTVHGNTASAIAEILAAARFDALVEAGLRVAEHEVLYGADNVDVEISWTCDGGHASAAATDYDMDRWRAEAAAVEWADAIEPQSKPLAVATTEEVPF